MNEQLFLKIIDHFLHPDKGPVEIGDLQTTEMEGLLTMARVQSLLPVVYEAVQGSAAFAALPQTTQAACKKEARQKVISQTMRTSLFLGIYQRILQAGVTPLVIKGLVLRNLYAKPDHRASADEDLLVKKEEFFALDKCLVDQGFSRELGEKPLEQHEITYVHGKSGMHLEIHLSLFPQNSEAYGYLNGAFQHVFDRQVTEEILGVGIHTMDPTQHMLYLLCHGVKHFLHSGFGIRQVCDMVMFAEQYGDRIDWRDVENRTRENDLYVFWMNLCFMAEDALGFSWEKAGLARPTDVAQDYEAMLSDILDAGVYGKSSSDRIHSANITLQAAAGGKAKGKLSESLFPDLNYMIKMYPYLNQHKWLLPVAWCQRIVYYLGHTKHGEAVQTVQTGQRRVELMKRYGLMQEEKKRENSWWSGRNLFEKAVLILLAVSVTVFCGYMLYDRLTRDDTAPEITCSQEVLETDVAITEEELLKDVRAQDDKDGDLTANVVVESMSAVSENNTRVVTYAAMDLSGNVGRAERTIHYTDYQPPRIWLDGPLRIKGYEALYSTLDSLRADSPLDGDLSRKIKYNFLESKPIGGEGIYRIELRVNDSAGNSTVIPTTVEIYNQWEEPVEVELSQYILYLHRNNPFVPADYYRTASESGQLTIDSNVDTSAPGVYHVTYTVENADSGHIGKSRLIVVVEE